MDKFIPSTLKKKRWLWIIIGYLIVTAVSNVFRFGIPHGYKACTLPYGLTDFKYLSEGVWLLIGYFILRMVTNDKPLITPSGIRPKRNILMLLLPLVLFTWLGADNELGLNRHYSGFILGITTTLYVLFEEFAWRGVLQNELSAVTPFIRYPIIGLFWYLWHLSFLSAGTSIPNELAFLVLFIVFSWGIGQIAEKTRSLFACAYFHLIGSIVSFSPLIAHSFSPEKKWFSVILLIGLGIFLVNSKDRKNVEKKSRENG